MSHWRNLGRIWCNWPSRPIGLIELIGGSYLSASPHISYKFLLEALREKGLAIHAWTYLPSLDHQAQANEAWKNFRLCRKRLESRVGVKLTPLRIGHSLGCKLHLLSPDGGRNSKVFISLSFNNFNANNSIPMIGRLSSKLNLETEFSPNPQETMNLIFNHYNQPNNLIIDFSNDKLDQSKLLIKCLKKREQDSSKSLQLEGDHLTPVSSGLRQNILGEWAVDDNKIKTLKTLTTQIYNYSTK